MSTDLDFDHIRDAAREALSQPSDSAMWDDRLYESHGCVFGWADRGDDILAESNFYAMLSALNGAVAHDETGMSEEREDDVIDVSVSHWLVGTMRQIFVRVFTDDTETEFTPAFIEAVSLADALRDYPMLDESDYSEREYNAWEETVNDAMDGAESEFDVDTETERQMFYTLMTHGDNWRRDEPDGYSGPDLMSDVGFPEVSYGRVEELYREIRSAHFEFLAGRIMGGNDNV